MLFWIDEFLHKTLDRAFLKIPGLWRLKEYGPRRWFCNYVQHRLERDDSPNETRGMARTLCLKNAPSSTSTNAVIQCACPSCRTTP